MESILVPVSMFAMIFGVVFISVTARNRERLALIANGATAEEVRKKSGRNGALKFGLLAIGVALGIVSGFGFHKAAGLPAEIAMPAMIFLFGGIGLVSYYFLSKKLEAKPTEH